MARVARFGPTGQIGLPGPIGPTGCTGAVQGFGGGHAIAKRVLMAERAPGGLLGPPPAERVTPAICFYCHNPRESVFRPCPRCGGNEFLPAKARPDQTIDGGDR